MATTTSSALPQEFVDQLSKELILQPDPGYIFAQLAGGARAGAMGIPEILGRAGAAANLSAAMGAGVGTLNLTNPRFMGVAREFVKVVMDPGTTPGKVILIDQPRFLTDGTMTEAARRLTEGTGVTTAPIAVSLGQVSLTVREYGGPHTGAAVAPVGITDFLKRRSTHDLVEYVGVLLRRDRNAWLDRVLCNMLLTTTKQTVADGDTDATGVMTAGGNRFKDQDFAIIYRKLSERNIPTFSSGMYGLVMGARHLEDLRADSQYREITRYLGGDGPLMSGHIGDHAGFHVIISNNIPTVAVGAGGAVTGYQALAFGPGGLGWGIGMDAEARRDKNDDFGREDKMLWISHEAFGLLDEDFVEKIVSS